MERGGSIAWLVGGLFLLLGAGCAVGEGLGDPPDGRPNGLTAGPDPSPGGEDEGSTGTTGASGSTSGDDGGSGAATGSTSVGQDGLVPTTGSGTGGDDDGTGTGSTTGDAGTGGGSTGGGGTGGISGGSSGGSTGGTQPPTCDDAVTNGSETDVDCGGDVCEPCLEGEACVLHEDCETAYCLGGACEVPECLAADDCPAPPDAECTASVCAGSFTCEVEEINEGGTCEDGDLCSVGETCGGGSCGGGSPKDCSGATSNQCKIGYCDGADGSCKVKNAPQGTPCDDDNPCTWNDHCNGGTCAGGLAPCDTNDPCMYGYCDPGLGTCEQIPIC